MDEAEDSALGGRTTTYYGRRSKPINHRMVVGPRWRSPSIIRDSREGIVDPSQARDVAKPIDIRPLSIETT